MTDSWFLFELSFPEAEVLGAMLLPFRRSMPFLAAATAKAHTLRPPPPPCRQSARHAACEPSYIRDFPNELAPTVTVGLCDDSITVSGTVKLFPDSYLCDLIARPPCRHPDTIFGPLGERGSLSRKGRPTRQQKADRSRLRGLAADRACPSCCTTGCTTAPIVQRPAPAARNGLCLFTDRTPSRGSVTGSRNVYLSPKSYAVTAAYGWTGRYGSAFDRSQLDALYQVFL